MRQRNVTGDFFRLKFNKYTLIHGGLFLCMGVLVFMLVTQGQTHPLNFALICTCSILSAVLQSCFYRTAVKQKRQSIILPWSVMMAVILGEICLIALGAYSATLRYAAFTHLTIKGAGLAAAVVCFLCLAEKRRLTAGRLIIFNLSFTVLASSVCILSMLRDMSLDKTVELWWGKYALMEAGILVIGTLSGICSSLLLIKQTP